MHTGRTYRLLETVHPFVDAAMEKRTLLTPATGESYEVLETTDRYYRIRSSGGRELYLAPGDSGAFNEIGLRDMPTGLLSLIGHYVGGTVNVQGNARATDPRSLARLAQVNRGLYQILAHSAPHGLQQTRAVALHARTPNHVSPRNLDGNPGAFEPHEAATLALPATLQLDPDSAALFRARVASNAFSGAVDIRTGTIYLYPLESSDIDDDGYGNTPFEGAAAQFHGQPVVPINHFDDPRGKGGGWVSHELLVLLIEEARAGHAIEIGRKDDLSPYLAHYVGFTLWANKPGRDASMAWFVWSSRSLNQPKFYTSTLTLRGGGHPSQRWAELIAAACARDLPLFRPVQFAPLPDAISDGSKRRRFEPDDGSSSSSQ